MTELPPILGAKLPTSQGVTASMYEFVPRVPSRIIDFFYVRLVGSIGIEPVAWLPGRLEIAEECIAAERHPHQAAGIGNFGLGDSSRAEAHAPDKVKATLMALFCRVEIGSDRVDITLSR